MTDPILLDAYLQSRLKPKRYDHCHGVAQCARDLALRYGADPERAYLAGLAHDMSKWMTDQQYLDYALQCGVEPDPFQRQEPSMLHGQVSALLLHNLFNEQDEQVLRAVRLHIAGAPDMTRLDACVCLADWIEPSRDYPDVPDLRKLAKKSLEKALQRALATTMVLHLDRGDPVWPQSLLTYNAITRLIERNEEIQ